MLHDARAVRQGVHRGNLPTKPISVAKGLALSCLLVPVTLGDKGGGV